MYLFKSFVAMFLATLFLVNFSFAQEYEIYKGTQLHSFKKNFKEMVEQDKLYPEMKTSGRKIKNNFEKYPDQPFDENNIAYLAEKGQYQTTMLQKEMSPPPDKDFLGLDDSGGSIPPDVNGCPGPDHLMVTLNTDTRIMTKDGDVISTISTGIFWNPLPGSGDTFDPKISYDPYRERWIYVIPSGSTPTTSRLFVGVSENSDPTGNWYIYSFDADPNDNAWFDYPNYGFNKDKLVVTGNMFGGGVYVAVFVFDLNELYENAAEINYTRISSYYGFTIVPAKTYDEEEEDIYMIHNVGGNGGYGYVNLWKVSGPATNPQLENLGTIGVPEPWSNGSYANGGNFAPQLGTDLKINTVDARMENMIFRNGKVWATHHVYLPANNPNRCSVQWWEIDPFNVSLNQWGRVDDPTGEMYYAFATIAVNAKEDVLIGYGSFSENQYASGSYAMRYGDDPPNTMRESYQYKDGLAPYWKTFGGDRNRWGDYTATWVDPEDDLDFWTLQEYADLPSGDDHWSTWWAYVDLHATPEVYFTASLQEIPIESTTNFTDLSKFNPDTWEWHFEGGEPATSNEQNPQNIFYAEPGLYDVTLIAGNGEGYDTLVMSDFINVNTTILPEVNFTVSDTLPETGSPVLFEDHSLYNPVNWKWEFLPDMVTFLEGTNENSQNPVVSFDFPYNYTVRLIAENNNGNAELTRDFLINAGGVQLPFLEDFESASLDSKSWAIDNPDEKKTWEILPLSVGESEYASYVNIKGYNGFGERDRLITPLLNFYYQLDVNFSFKYAYAQRIPDITDSLIVYLSQDGGDSWERLLAFGEDSEEARSFATSEPTFNNFLPTDTSLWCGAFENPECVSIDLSEYKGQSNLRIMFESYNSFGNNIIIDDVEITGTINSISENQNLSSLSIFPNPSNGIISITNDTEKLFSISVFNTSGKKVYEHLVENPLKQVTLNLDHLPGGVYIIEGKTQNSIYTQKLILR